VEEPNTNGDAGPGMQSALKMVKIMIDTNVLVSASLRNGYSFRVIDAIVMNSGSFEVCLSEQVVTEYYNLVFYGRISNKYPLFTKNLSDNIHKLEKAGTMFFPKTNFKLIKDVSDNKFLNLAHEAKGDYIITGNKNDFSITQFEQTKILNPKKFCELYETDSL
jgi:putative PIN family toxin of toxin-antitoxin system